MCGGCGGAGSLESPLEVTILREVLQYGGQFRYIWRPSQVIPNPKRRTLHRRNPADRGVRTTGRKIDGRNPTFRLTRREHDHHGELSIDRFRARIIAVIW